VLFAPKYLCPGPSASEATNLPRFGNRFTGLARPCSVPVVHASSVFAPGRRRPEKSDHPSDTPNNRRAHCRRDCVQSGRHELWRPPPRFRPKSMSGLSCLFHPMLVASATKPITLLFIKTEEEHLPRYHIQQSLSLFVDPETLQGPPSFSLIGPTLLVFEFVLVFLPSKLASTTFFFPLVYEPRMF
jgi:hypothetical protein